MKRNVLIGFIFPWILGLWLIKKDKETFKKLYPFSTMISVLISLWGDYNQYWILNPKLRKRQYLTNVPFNFGLYPILGILMIFLIKKFSINTFLWILMFFILTTIKELLLKRLGIVNYYNHWNLSKTFLSYLIPYFLTYNYYLKCCK